MGVIGCFKGLVEAKHRIRVENFRRDSKINISRKIKL